MKRTYSFFAIALFIAITFCSNAQTRLENVNSVVGNVTKTIIRETATFHSISYFETAIGHYFAYYDGSSGSVITVPININFSVNDFVISDDSVFFCGIFYTIGSIGHFNIQDFFYGSHTYYNTSFNFYYNTAASPVYVRSFDKMVAFSDSGIRKVAAIGMLTNNSYAVMEARYAFSPNNTTVSYVVGTAGDAVLDIALTDNYVVTAGFNSILGVGPLPFVRVYERGSLFQSGGPQDTVTFFSKYGSQTVRFNARQLVLSHLQGDDFALAAYWRNLNATTDTGTFISLQNIAANHDVSWISSMVTTQYRQNGGWQLHGLTPMDNSSYFYLLQTAEIVNLSTDESLLFMLTPSMFSLAPYGGTMTVKQMNRPQLTSIDARAGYWGFVSCGIDYITPDNMVCCLSTSNTPGCSNDRIMPIYPIDMVGSEQYDAFQVNSGGTVFIGSTVGTPIMLEKHIFCKE